MRNLLNQKGVSLIQVLFISAILGGLALIGTNIITSEKAAQKGAQNKDDIEILHQLVTNLLQDKKHCTGTLVKSKADGLLSGAWKTAPTDIQAVYLVQTTSTGDTYSEFLKKAPDTNYLPRYMNGNVYIRGIRVDYPNRLFSIDYAKVNTKSTSAAMITKRVNNITFKTEGTVDTCYADSEGVNNQTAREFCESLGQLFTWNDTIKDCTLSDHRCTNSNEIFVGIRSDGASVCKPLGQYTDWGNLIDSSAACNPTAPNTSVSLEYIGGKIRIKCEATGPCTTPPLCADPSFSCVGTNLGTNGCGQSCGTGTKPATNGTWTYSAWSTCSSGTQTRTATCNATCGGSCGPQDPLSQACTACVNVTRCSNWQFKFFKDYCGKQWYSASSIPVKGYNFNGYYRPDSSSVAPNGYYDSGYNCSSTVVECVPSSEVGYYWTNMSYSWPLQSRCQQNGDCVATCSCPSSGCASTQMPSGW